jgi:ABC-type bacteriocin/lantibiotic exporter with double-glycine peptidase domain
MATSFEQLKDFLKDELPSILIKLVLAGVIFVVIVYAGYQLESVFTGGI